MRKFTIFSRKLRAFLAIFSLAFFSMALSGCFKSYTPTATNNQNFPEEAKKTALKILEEEAENGKLSFLELCEVESREKFKVKKARQLEITSADENNGIKDRWTIRGNYAFRCKNKTEWSDADFAIYLLEKQGDEWKKVEKVCPICGDLLRD